MSYNNGRLSAADRRTVRKAIAEGRPVTDPRLEPYAVARIRKAKVYSERMGRKFESTARRRRIPFLVMAVLGAAVLWTGLKSFNAVNVAIGIADLVLAISFLMLEPFAKRSAQRLITKTTHADRVQAGEHTED